MFRGYLFIISAATCWGFVGIFSSVAFSQGIQPLEVAFWRAVITWLCFAVMAIRQKQTRADLRDAPLLALFALFGVSLFYVSYLYAVDTGGAALASVLLYTAPAWVVICSYFINKEQLTWLKFFSVIFVISGVVLISFGGGNISEGKSISIFTLIAGLTSGFCYSLYYTLGKYFSKKYSAANLFLYLLPLGAMGILPFVEFSHKTLLAWIALFSVAVLSTFIANICYYAGLKYLEAGKAAIIATFEPVIAAIAAYLILGEYFTLPGYLGAMLIFVAVLVISYDRSGSKRLQE